MRIKKTYLRSSWCWLGVSGPWFPHTYLIIKVVSNRAKEMKKIHTWARDVASRAPFILVMIWCWRTSVVVFVPHMSYSYKKLLEVVEQKKRKRKYIPEA